MFGLRLGRLGGVGASSQIQRAISLLRRFGSDAHLWLPGGDVKTYGPELVVNGDFSNGTTGWTALPVSGVVGGGLISSSNGGIRVTNDSSGTNYGVGSQSFTTVVGKSYQVTLTRLGNSGGTTYFHVGVAGSGTLANSILANQTGSTAIFVATAATTFINLSAVTSIANGWAEWDNISVREITSITSVIQNGLSTGNYLESTGNTVLTVDNPAGLVLDALGTRVTLTVPQDLTSWTSGGGFGNFNGASATATTITASGEQGSRYIRFAVSPGDMVFFDAMVVAGTSTGVISVSFGTAASVYIDALYPAFVASGAVHAAMQAPANAAFVELLVRAQTSGATCGFTGLSASKVSGIHLTQATTANKGVLRLTSGRYNWVFDATDLLTGTFPAGYESVTVIDAKSTGQVTTAAANIVGSYSIGPSYTSYGRIVVKGSLTASELTLLQGFANKLAGL